MEQRVFEQRLSAERRPKAIRRGQNQNGHTQQSLGRVRRAEVQRKRYQWERPAELAYPSDKAHHDAGDQANADQDYDENREQEYRSNDVAQVLRASRAASDDAGNDPKARVNRTSTGAFDRIRPLHNYGKEGGTGAWELAARLSYLNLNDDGVEGGRLRDLTLGVNWYLNPSVRTMWNYILADPSEGGDLNAFLWRLQVAF